MNVEKIKNILTPEEENEENNISRTTRTKSKINRLKRSPKQTQTFPKSQPKPKTNDFTAQSDFKTPTRVPQARFRTPLTDESPNNDAEFQHEIIWDSTSPLTPIRPGRGSRRAACFRSIDISDLVNRIAPQDRRPEEAETSLLQWIGDTAIPCTPEVSEPRPRTKSTRQNTVDNLLILAKQFDFNMIHHEAPCLQTMLQNSEDTIGEDQELFFNEDEPAALLHNNSKTVTASDNIEGKTNFDDSMVFDLGMEDDLDLLFDISTQQVSTTLSPGLNRCSQDMAEISLEVLDFDVDKNNSKLSNRELTKNQNGARESTTVKGSDMHQVTNFQKMHSTDDFDDDWSNDDLLEDSLVMEMTQNPELFSAPQKSSQHRLTGVNGNEEHSLHRNRDGFANSANHQLSGSDLKCSTTQGRNQTLKGSQSFHQGNQSAGTVCIKQQGFPSKNNQQQQFCPSSKIQSVVSGSLNLNSNQSNVLMATYQTRKPTEMKRPARTGHTGSAQAVQSSTKMSIESSNPVQRSLLPNKNINNAFEKENHPMADDRDIAVDDLDSIFASDDIWDDGAVDDDLFCAACEKLEELMTEPEPSKPIFMKPQKPTPQSNQMLQNRMAVSSNCRNATTNMNEPDKDWVSVPPQNHTSSITQKQDLHGGITHNYKNTSLENTVNNSTKKTCSSSSDGRYKFTHIKSTSGISSLAYHGKMQQQVCHLSPLTSHQTALNASDDHQFKKPYSTFNGKLANSEGVGRCSEAEIEMKKQQAIERRRLRMLASQNFGALT